MATTLAALAQLTLNASLASAVNVAGSATANFSKSYGAALTAGTGASQADTVWFSTRSLAASASENLDLAGVLTDPYGNVLTFARIKALAISADPANTNNVSVGNATSNGVAGLFGALTHTGIVRPGATLAWLCGPADTTGYPVTPGTGDLLQVLNAGAGTLVLYTVYVVGCSV